MARTYFTTPIYYVSDPPHIGHSYTTIVADALTRWHKMRGDDTRFLTGTDEHGQKIERMAASRGKDPASYAAEISRLYEDAWKRLEIANDGFIRTTDPGHEAEVQALWKRMEARGDIYENDYEGWYCVACEQYYTEKELNPGNVCPVHARPVEKVKEHGFFFRLKSYQQKLLEFYDRIERETGRPFIEPRIRMNEVRNFVESGLEDISISRTTFSWGVPVPDKPGHVVYVWLDALTNYYSATRFMPSLAGMWDDDVDIVHIMGKEITRFHAVYWPAFLMSAGLRPPSKIVAHGWWTVDGEKMSKTRGNVVDPLRLAEDLGSVDAVRYFLLREVPLGADGDFSHEALLNRYNAELCNDLGNLLNRTLGMAQRYFNGAIESTANLENYDIQRCISAVDKHLMSFEPSKALEEIWKLVRYGNLFIEQSAPWRVEKPQQANILGNALEVCRILSHLVAPFMPEIGKEIRRQIGVSEEAHVPSLRQVRNFTCGPGTPLFPRLDDARKAELLAKWTPKPAATEIVSDNSTPVELSDKKPSVAYDDFAKLDLRVAKIVAAERVPKKDRLLKLTVDVGGAPRTVVAGIAGAYEPDALVGRSVIFLANLAPAKIGGIVSEGMILAAGDPAVVALSSLDRDCPPGTKVK